jgi:alpha-beta hydrolase superfamily lysophospholipase
VQARVRATVIVMAIVTAVALLPASPALGAVAADDVDAPPSPLPAAAPGTLIRAEPIGAPAGARAWRILYHSRALDGRDVAESGLVVAPTGPAPPGGRPVMSWAHGTSGLADTCAPSRAADAASAVPYVADLLAHGYVVAAADYEGLGTPGPHPYLVGPSEGRSVLDAARAARHVDGAGAGRTVVVAGHSQGGQAAVFAGELARRYAPDLDVRGAAALAPAEADRLLSATETRPDMQGFVAMAAEGLRAAFPKADVDAVLTPGAVSTLRELDGTACVFATLAGFRDRGITALRADPNSVPSVRAALRRSVPARTRTTVPLAVYQGGEDQLVLPDATAAFVARACARGDRVAARVFPDADHGGVLEVAAPALLQWLDDRVAGVPAPSTCRG